MQSNPCHKQGDERKFVKTAGATALMALSIYPHCYTTAINEKISYVGDIKYFSPNGMGYHYYITLLIQLGFK